MTPFNGFSLGFAASLTGLDWVGLGVICSIASEPRPASKIGRTPSAPLAIEIAAERREKEWDANERGWRLVAGVVSFIFFFVFGPGQSRNESFVPFRLFFFRFFGAFNDGHRLEMDALLLSWFRFFYSRCFVVWLLFVLFFRYGKDSIGTTLLPSERLLFFLPLQIR